MAEAENLNVKQCCAALYGSELAHLLLGESFHPGGTQLTEHLGRLMGLNASSRVLDVAAGSGASAFHIVSVFDCEVVGVDLSSENVNLANQMARVRGIEAKASFRTGDAEGLPFGAESFDAVLCECALCTFPNKQLAAREFSRVLRPQGRLGISDLTKVGDSPAGLDGLLSWIACIGDAQPVERYMELLESERLAIRHVEDHSHTLMELVRQIQGRLLGVEIAASVQKSSLDLQEAKRFIQAAGQAIRSGKLGYAAITAAKLQ